MISLRTFSVLDPDCTPVLPKVSQVCPGGYSKTNRLLRASRPESLSPFLYTSSLQNRSIADRVLSAVEKTLHSSPFNFQGARVISGQEEGAYGWITINYLLGNFKQVTCPIAGAGVVVQKCGGWDVVNHTWQEGFRQHWLLLQPLLPGVRK